MRRVHAVERGADLVQRFGFLCGLLLLAWPRNAQAWNSPAPDIVLYCTPAMQAPLHELAQHFTADKGVKIHIFVAPPDGLIGLIKHRARDDVVVADASTLENLAANKLVRPETLTPLGNNPFVLASGAGATLPAGAQAADLAASHTIVLTDATTAASFDGAAILRTALPNTAPLKTIGVANTQTVLAELRADTSLLGLVNRTEAHSHGISQAATLAAPPTPTSGAIVTEGQSANAAAFLAFIASPAGTAMLTADGLEPKS